MERMTMRTGVTALALAVSFAGFAAPPLPAAKPASVGKYLPGFDKMQVSLQEKTAEAAAYKTVPQERAMTVQDLLRHSSGLAYGEITQNAPVKEGLEKAGVYRKDMDYEARGVTPKEQV